MQPSALCFESLTEIRTVSEKHQTDFDFTQKVILDRITFEKYILFL